MSKDYFKSTEKTYYQKTFGKNWNIGDIKDFFIKLSIFVYLGQLIVFDFDYLKPFIEGWGWYLIICLIYWFLKAYSGKHYYFRIDNYGLKEFENGKIVLNIPIEKIKNILVNENQVFDRYQWDSVNILWEEENYEGIKNTQAFMYVFKNDELASLINFLKNNEVWREKWDKKSLKGIAL